MTGSIYGYVRVSTREQNEDRQLIALREVGVSDKNIFMDKQNNNNIIPQQGDYFQTEVAALFFY